jgi:hypothetical protein
MSTYHWECSECGDKIYSPEIPKVGTKPIFRYVAEFRLSGAKIWSTVVFAKSREGAYSTARGVAKQEAVEYDELEVL